MLVDEAEGRMSYRLIEILTEINANKDFQRFSNTSPSFSVYPYCAFNLVGTSLKVIPKRGAHPVK